MKGSVQRWTMLVGLIVVAVSPLMADEPEGELVVAVSGQASGEKNLALSLRFGASVTDAVRVYSEPSHTLLAAIMDQSFAETDQGQAWRSSHEDAAALVEAPLPESQPMLVIPGRPADDTRIAVWIHGDLHGDGSTETLVADALVGAESQFTFSTHLGAAGGVE